MRAPWIAVALLAPALASAQTVEDRLRDALRRQTAEARAAQDAQAGLQAQLDQAAKQRDVLQQQVTDLTAKLAEAPAAPAPGAAPKAAPPPDDGAIQALRAAQDQARAAQQALGKYQASYEQAAGIARAKDAEGRQAQAAASAAQARVGACETENGKLLGVANDILHLYETAGFRRTIAMSYEPLLGIKRVELQNVVQDYEDKIRDHQYVAPRAKP